MNLRNSILLASAVAMICQNVIAATPFFWEDKGEFWKVSVSGNAPNSSVDFQIPLVLIKQQPKFCGYIKTKFLPEFVNNYIYTSDNRELLNPQLVDAKCSANIWKNAAGAVVTPPAFFKDAASNVFIRSSGELNLHLSSINKTVTRKTNACGLASFSFPKAWDNINGFNAYVVVQNQTSYYDYTENVSTVCKKVGNDFVQYIPLK
ncbi:MULTISPECIES: hypothetical protein [unclassified Microcoleus]|uniref:hypothetical protein n=1 Tax=unclassified Microcoleus TaxID=2642155 RepID=UPI002FD76C70